jgi:hypothetical protein
MAGNVRGHLEYGAHESGDGGCLPLVPRDAVVVMLQMGDRRRLACERLQILSGPGQTRRGGTLDGYKGFRGGASADGGAS